MSDPPACTPEKAKALIDAHLKGLEELRSSLQKEWGGGAVQQLADPPKITPFAVEWYKLHRAHELELNRAALQYEHERLRFLAYLNGGAVGLSITLLGSLKAQGSKVHDLLGTPFLVALGLWTLGLVVAWFAWSLAHVSQSYYTTAYRMRRYGYEKEHEGHYDFGITQSLPPYDDDKVEKLNGMRPLLLILGCQPNGRDVEENQKPADVWRKQAGFLQRKWQFLSSMSLGMFAFGALAALMTFRNDSTDPGGDGRASGAPSTGTEGASQGSDPSIGSPNTPTQSGPAGTVPAGASAATSAGTGGGAFHGSPPAPLPDSGASGAAGRGMASPQGVPTGLIGAHLHRSGDPGAAENSAPGRADAEATSKQH